MGRGEGEIVEKGRIGVVRGMILQHLDGVVGEGDGAVESRVLFNRRQRLVVLEMFGGIEEAPLVLEVVGVIESLGDRLAVDVPLAGVIGTVTDLLESFRKQLGPSRALILVASSSGNRGEGIAPDLLGIIAGEESAPGRPAARGVVELGEAKAVLRDRVEVGRVDLTAVAAEVGVAEIVREDEEHVRAGCGGSTGEEKEEGGEQQGSHADGES